MDQRIVQFIAALRASGIRVSLAESADAFLAIEQTGVRDRDVFRTSLRTTLIKDNTDVPRFEQLFPLFFQAADAPPPMNNPSENLTEEEAQMISEALRQYTEQIRQMLQKMLEGKPLTRDELRRLDSQVNLSRMKDLRNQQWLSNKMDQALQFRAVQQALKDLMRMLAEMGLNQQKLDELQEMMAANQQAMKEQIQKYVGQRLAENLSEQTRREPLDDLFNRPFSALSEEEMQSLRREIKRLAAALRTRMALRLKRARSGQLDVKGTLRSNLKHGNVPIQLKHRDRVLKPKLVVLCDLSTSMRHCSELMLSMIYAIQDQISKTHAFAYIDDLKYISAYFDGRQPYEAVEEILNDMPSGYYNTDLGHSLENFTHSFMDTVDYRTTLIVVGDARNNYNDPRLEVFRDIAHRSRSTIWLNPEANTSWGYGDSDMLKYAPLCSRIFQVSNLSQLTVAIDSLLLQH
ncbi:MAG: VWA domain-containing protein [Anaerolineaceae bacterium]|nr:VWA domain-containing protein [Anaerolineaceae bacterium]